MEWLLNLGYFGLFLGSFVAATVVPFSSDVQLVAMLAAGGNVWFCVAVATLGNWLGGLTSYWLGWLGKWEWIEKYMRVRHETLIKHKSKVDRYGGMARPADLASLYRRYLCHRARLLPGRFSQVGAVDVDRQRCPLRDVGTALPLGQSAHLLTSTVPALSFEPVHAPQRIVLG